MVEPLILGVNPLIGVDHASADRARNKRNEGSAGDPLAVLAAAQESGATGFTFSPSTEVMEILKRAKDSGYTRPLRLYPLLPALDKYWPAFVERGTFGLVSAVLSDLSFGKKAKAFFKGSSVALTLDPVPAIKLYVSVELEKLRRLSPESWTVDAVFLGETFTDVLVSLGAFDLLRAFEDAVRSHRGALAGFQTLNLTRLLSASDELGLSSATPIMAPFNPIGFQMVPSRAECEQSARSHPEIPYVAISALAAGQIQLEAAANYIATNRDQVGSVAIGASTAAHARESFQRVGQALGPSR